MSQTNDISSIPVSDFLGYIKTLQVQDDIIENLENIIYAKDLQGKFILANKSAVRHFNKKHKSELVGKYEDDIMKNEIHQRSYEKERDELVLKSKSRLIYERKVSKQHEEMVYFVSKDIVRDNSGDIIGISIVMLDITKYKHDQDVLLKQREEISILNISNRIKSNFLSNLSHNLRTPLMGIMGAAFIDTNESDLSLSVKQDIELFRYSAELLMNAVNDIIDYAPIINNDIVLEPKIFKISTFIHFLKEIVYGICKERGIRFECKTDDNIPRIMFGDYKKLSHVVHKIILICLTDVSLDGYLHVSITKTPVERHNIDVSSNVVNLTFYIASSRQISHEVQERMFKPYTDMKERDLLEHESSIGLDLYITKRIIDALDGSLEFKLDKDSSFTLSIPLPVVESISHQDMRTSKMKIIVAEDNKINQKVMQRMLDKLHNHTFFADNGKVCMDEFMRNKASEDEEKYDLILMDIQMPIMNGIDATRKIRDIEKDNGWVPIKIMAITAFVTEQDRQDCYEAGMNGFISKPVTPDMMNDILLELRMKTDTFTH